MNLHFEQQENGTVWIHDGDAWAGWFDKLPSGEYAFSGFSAAELRAVADEMDRLAKEAKDGD